MMTAAAKRLLVLGGTRQARGLADALALAGHEVTYSIAGVTSDPRVAQQAKLRTGGFGGSEGLAGWCLAQNISALIDATHPFAAKMSRNAVSAAMLLDLPLLRLTRPLWQAQSADDWRYFKSLDLMVAELAQAELAQAELAQAELAQAGPRRILMSIGRQDVFRFTPLDQHKFWVRSVEPALAYPKQAEPLLGKGPFDLASEQSLLEDEKIDLIVAKDSGGQSGYAKLKAARGLGIPVWLLARPKVPPCDQVETQEQALVWVQNLD